MRVPSSPREFGSEEEALPESRGGKAERISRVTISAALEASDATGASATPNNKGRNPAGLSNVPKFALDSHRDNDPIRCEYAILAERSGPHI